MDDENSHGYPFDNACMTESCGDEMGPLPLPLTGAWGKEPNLRLVRSLDLRGWTLLCAAALGIALPGAVAAPGGSARAVTLEERKLPMKFGWVACEPNCAGWVSAVGIVTSDSPRDFDEFARGRDLAGATVVLDSSGGSVNDSIALVRRFHDLGLRTTVGTSVVTHAAGGDRGS